MSTSFLLLVLLLAAMAAASTDDNGVPVMPGCQQSCGGVDIPYPFGIGDDACFYQGFEIRCMNNGSSSHEIPVLATTNQAIQVLNLSVAPLPEARVLLPVAWQCFNSTGGFTGGYTGNVNFNEAGVYRISNVYNELYVLGCNTLIYVQGVKNKGGAHLFNYKFYAGCLSVANDPADPKDGACAGLGCCHVDIPPGLTDTSMTMFGWNGTTGWSHANQDYCPCDFAFIVEKGSYHFSASDLTTHVPSNQTTPLRIDWSMPLRLDWAIRDSDNASISCAHAASKPGYACLSSHSECVDSTNGPGYFCNCTKGYKGNPYVDGGDGGCTNINECMRPDEFPCHGECKDTDGSYECKCRPGYESDGDPKEKPCRPKLPGSAKRVIGITVGISVLVFIILGVGVCYLLKWIGLEAIQRKNGSVRLKNVKTLQLYTKGQLKKITRNSEVLGKGGFGEVRKGILSDHTEVAVKASIEVTPGTLDKFVKEVEIQSRMMHTNILKLLGCCLRVDIPLLVYEYAAKGSLKDILHGKNNDQHREDLTVESRLEIAIGSAQGLAYMHSYTENGIQHEDVKPDNILLDGGMVPKISDFGLSKVFVEGKDYTTNVIGCLAYMDPVYKNTGKITAKSDVYSFGIVLLELISRRPVVDGEHSLVDQFKGVYEKDSTGKVLFDKDIIDEEDIHILDAIGKLAMKCLKENVDERPSMASVASALVLLKDSWEEKVLEKEP